MITVSIVIHSVFLSPHFRFFLAVTVSDEISLIWPAKVDSTREDTFNITYLVSLERAA